MKNFLIGFVLSICVVGWALSFYEKAAINLSAASFEKNIFGILYLICCISSPIIGFQLYQFIKGKK